MLLVNYLKLIDGPNDGAYRVITILTYLSTFIVYNFPSFIGILSNCEIGPNFTWLDDFIGVILSPLPYLFV